MRPLAGQNVVFKIQHSFRSRSVPVSGDRLFEVDCVYHVPNSLILKRQRAADNKKKTLQ